MLPALVSQAVVLITDSSLGYIVSYAELLREINLVAEALTQPRCLLPMLTVGAGIFVTLNMSLSHLANRLDTRGDRRRLRAAPIRPRRGAVRDGPRAG